MYQFFPNNMKHTEYHAYSEDLNSVPSDHLIEPLVNLVNRIIKNNPKETVLFYDEGDYSAYDLCSLMKWGGLIDYKKRIRSETSEETYFMPAIDITIINTYGIKMLLSFFNSKIESIEPYTKDKQLSLIKEIILKKYRKLENKDLLIGQGDLGDDSAHIELIGALFCLEKDDFIKVDELSYVNIINEDGSLHCKFHIAKITIKSEPMGWTCAKNKDEKILTLECVKPSIGSKYNIIINNNYSGPIEVDKNIKTWELLLQLSIDGKVELDKSFLDYINGSRNQLVKKMGLIQTKIVKIDNNSIVPNIPISNIGEKSYKTKVNKINLS